MTVGITEIHSLARSIVQFIRRDVVAHFVTAIIGKPQFFRDGMPIETDRVSNSGCENLQSGTIGLHAIDHAVPFIGPANIARRTDGYVEQAVRSKRDELPAMVSFRRKVCVHDNRFRRILQVRFDAIEAKHARDLGHVQ